MMTQVEQVMAIILIIIAASVAAVILVVTVWVVLSIAIQIRRLTRELR